MTGPALTIGQLAARLGVPVRTVRFWSDEGLVDLPARSAGGYRLYDATAVGTTTEEMGIVHELVTLSARERQQLIDDFVAHAFEGVPEDAPGAGIAEWWIATLRAAD